MADDLETPAPAPDDYERRYMDGARALLRARQRQPRWLPITLLAIMALALTQVGRVFAWLWDHRDLPGMAVTLAFAVAWMLIYAFLTVFGLLIEHLTRVVLTPTHLRVHRGFWADDIALAAITSVSVEEVNWKRPRISLTGALLRRERAYPNFGVAHALLVEWRDAKGRGRKSWVAFDDAPAFYARIVSLTAGATGVRVASEEGAVDEEPEVGSEVQSEGEEAGSTAPRRGRAVEP